MTELNTLTYIHKKAAEHNPFTNNKILWSLHAVKKLRIEQIRKNKVESSLTTCTLVENYPAKGRPLPDCLVLVYIDNKPVHVVIAEDRKNDRIIIVTVYTPSEERWTHDWKTRKK